jgi:hypothetical protein
MAYTVDHLYKKIIEGTDKMGSDFYTLPYVMNRLEAAVYDFIGETVKYIENTQEIRDDIRTLYKPFNIAVVVDPADASYQSIALPSDYLHLMSSKVTDKFVTVRQTRTIRHGQEDIFESDPDTIATAEYPSLVLYENVIRILSPGTPISIKGFYIKKPTFGGNDINHDDIQNEIAVNLPDNVTDKIIKTIINDIFVSTGDPRAQMQYQVKETYRKR